MDGVTLLFIIVAVLIIILWGAATIREAIHRRRVRKMIKARFAAYYSQGAPFRALETRTTVKGLLA